jgi:hypothetical protein
MRLTPVIALVNDQALDAIHQVVDNLPPEMAEKLGAACVAHGWTVDALIAGQFINEATKPA